MKNGIQILGRLSVGLLICVLLVQGIGLYLICEMKIDEFFWVSNGILWVEAILLLGFVIYMMQMTLRRARVQTIGMTYSKDEQKKPLAAMISVIDGMLEHKESVLCSEDETKLRRMKARLMKMADITNTMLSPSKTSVLKIEREVIDLEQEMEMITEMFSLIRPHALVGYQIDEGLEPPCLDKVYFNYILFNLVDNAIKYGKTHPVVRIDFYADGKRYILTVEDNGEIIPKNQQAAKNAEQGLIFIHKVVRAYGGKIRLENKVGIGNKFTIILPQKPV